MLKLKYKECIWEAGCDEAGRGCLAGPVFAAAVILPDNFHNELLNDSKQLTEKQRDYLRPIIEQQALAWAVASMDNQEIDQINILNASIAAMHKASAFSRNILSSMGTASKRIKIFLIFALSKGMPNICPLPPPPSWPKPIGMNIWKL